MPERYDVAIVGYGPVGQMLAILLGQRGWRVGVFEKQPAPYPLPRAVHFDHEIGRILQAAGVADDVAGRTESADLYEWRNAAGATLLRFESKSAGLSGWPSPPVSGFRGPSRSNVSTGATAARSSPSAGRPWSFRA